MASKKTVKLEVEVYNLQTPEMEEVVVYRNKQQGKDHTKVVATASAQRTMDKSKKVEFEGVKN